MKKNNIHLLGLICLSLGVFLQVCSLESGIKEIISFDVVDFSSIKKGSLVVFDVDKTLIQPVDAYLMHQDTPEDIKFRADLFKKHSRIPKEKWRNCFSIMLQKAEQVLIEPQIINHINTLKERGIPVIACTALETGHYGKIKAKEQWRYEHLKSLGFEGSFNDIELQFTFLNNPRRPMFYKGILATDIMPKGEVIGAFLDQLKLNPLKLNFYEIIMFDDKREFLESVEKECIKRNIIFQGYLYKGASEEKPWNNNLFLFQIRHLLKTERWLNDKDVEARLQRHKNRADSKIMHQ